MKWCQSKSAREREGAFWLADTSGKVGGKLQLTVWCHGSGRLDRLFVQLGAPLNTEVEEVLENKRSESFAEPCDR